MSDEDRAQPFSMNCPIRERTADGKSVGRCWHYAGPELVCPRHGDIKAAVEIYKFTGQLTDENEFSSLPKINPMRSNP